MYRTGNLPSRKNSIPCGKLTPYRQDIPTGHKPISAKLHLKIKQDPVRNTIQHKARSVVRGFNQKAGIDYNDIYSPVASFKSILALLTVGASKDYEIHQMDFDAAFLNATIKEEVYVEPIRNFDSRVPDRHVHKLHKTLYGLKQSPREWWLLLQDSRIPRRLCGWHRYRLTQPNQYQSNRGTAKLAI